MLVERQIVVPAPLEEAWTVLLDWERQAGWMADADSVSVVSEHREGVGVRLSVRTRLFGIAAFTEPMEVLAWDPPRRLEIGHGSLVAGVGTWMLEPVDGCTRFTWREQVRLDMPVLGELAAAIYRPVLLALMDRSMRGFRGYLIAAGPARTRAFGATDTYTRV
ncbi:MAG TPA: SRPBCC family protein [Actinomycetota bacterium]|nr:SRPBCC family protein [Actinomycetota bacterium]